MELSWARVFADVGCDHGYMAKYMLEKGLCERAYISDVSAKSLKKAEALLWREIASGKCIPIVADGLKGIREPCDLLLIAGLGGEEIVRILKESYLPEKFVFQPMKNSEKLRAYLVEKGAGIQKDYTFGRGYFYDLITGHNAGDSHYTEKELFWGRDNLRAPGKAFYEKLRTEKRKIIDYLERGNLSRNSKNELLMRQKALEEVLYETEKSLLGNR